VSFYHDLSAKYVESDQFLVTVIGLCNRILAYGSLEPAPHQHALDSLGFGHTIRATAPPGSVLDMLDRTVGIDHMVRVLDLLTAEEWQGRAAGTSWSPPSPVNLPGSSGPR
jgi:hypothetical protein